jgi:hypothetical protein
VTHLDEETLAAASLDLLSGEARDSATKHLEQCALCRQAVADYQTIIAALRTWQEAPQKVVEAGARAVGQRARIYRLLGQMVMDPTLRGQAQRDPEALLAAHGITPNPQLLAAFRELDVDRLARLGSEVDERITKLLNFLS